MKLKPLILSLFFTTYSLLLFAQNTYNWNDTVFVKGAKRIICIERTYDKLGITESSKDSLKPLFQMMKENPFLKIEIDCHTDPQGSDKHNIFLSQACAQICVGYIRYLGIDSARLVAKGWGFRKTLPGCSINDIAKMKTKEEKLAAWGKDRRTEATIIGPDSANIFQWSDVKFMKYSLRRVRFTYELDKGQLRADSENHMRLDTVVKFLRSHPYLAIGVYAHTDPQGSNKHDYILSQDRAQTITNALVKMGIDPRRITTKGWEARKPLISQKKIAAMKTQEEKEAAYAMDRRTEIVILGMRK